MAILAPRFLASAFASGPALLILLCMLISWLTNARLPREAIQKLAVIVTNAMVISVFFVLMEFFTAFYSGIPEHTEQLRYMFTGLDGHWALTPWMWTSMALAAIALVLLIRPKFRADHRLLALACAAVFLSLWIDKGIGLIALAIWAIGALVLTVFYKIALAVREEPFLTQAVSHS